MPKPPVPAAVAEELAKPWHATISTVRPDGQPVSVPTWYLDDSDLHDIDRIARHYTGKAHAVRDRPRVSAWVEIDRWHAWGRLKGMR